MRKSVLATAAAAALALGSVAQASVIVTGNNTPIAPPFTDTTGFDAVSPGVMAAAGYVGVKLSFVSDQGVISAIDLSTAPRGVFGPLQQMWVVGAQSPTGASLSNLDSHLLAVDGVNAVSIIGASEDNPGTGSPAVSPIPGLITYGIGTNLKASWGVIAASQGSTVDFAYIVGKPGDQIHVLGQVSAGGQAVSVDQTVVITPEPASFGLLGLGSLGLLARRRRA